MKQYYLRVIGVKFVQPIEEFGHIVPLMYIVLNVWHIFNQLDTKLMIKPTFDKSKNWTIREKLKESKNELCLHPAYSAWHIYGTKLIII